jgi:hypothetical protein
MEQKYSKATGMEPYGRFPLEDYSRCAFTWSNTTGFHSTTRCSVKLPPPTPNASFLCAEHERIVQMYSLDQHHPAYCVKCGEKRLEKLVKIEEGVFTKSHICRGCVNSFVGVHFKDQGSWFRVEGQTPTLLVAPAYDDGSVDATGWGPVEEHGFVCMGIRGDHEHDPAAVEWMVQINDTFNTSFTLEEFE